MNQTFEITKTSRKILAQFLENYSLEQLNKIPEGFSNNLIWNIGHIVAVQQGLVYGLSGTPMNVREEIITKFKKGTKPEQAINQDEVNEIKALLFSTIDKTIEDYTNETFKNYKEYPTSTGFVLKTVEDAISFNNFHEGLHIGIMMNIRKFV